VSSRANDKQLAQQPQADQQASQQPREAHQRRRLLTLVGLLAVVIVGAVAYFALRSDDPASPDPAKVAASASSVPQHGAVAGNPQAKVSIVEYADLQCPACSAFSRQELPQILNRFVKTGQATFELRHWAILGEQSRTAAAGAVAAAAQDKALQFVEVFYGLQKAENSGYVTPQFLDSIAAQAGLDVKRFRADLAGVDASKAITVATTEAQLQGLQGTPSFIITGPGGAVRLTGADDVQRFAQAIAQVSRPRPVAQGKG
jgi:protein-disulfide isomerase